MPDKMKLSYSKHKDGLWYFKYLYQGWGFIEIRDYHNPFTFGFTKIAFQVYELEIMNISIPGYFFEEDLDQFLLLYEKLVKPLKKNPETKGFYVS